MGMRVYKANNKRMEKAATRMASSQTTITQSCAKYPYDHNWNDGLKIPQN